MRRPIDQYEDLSVDAPGADEVQIVPWPLLLRQRLAARVERSDRYPWIVLWTVLFGLFSVGFTITILSNSLSRIARDLDTDLASVTWVLTGPLLAFAVFGPTAGKLADLRGQRRVYLASIAGVAVFAALTAAAPTVGSLILFRTLGAAIGAATGPASLAIINRLFPSAQRAKAMGYWAMVGAGGPVVGVVAGGPIVEAFGWRWIFVAQVPLTLITLFLAAAVLPETPSRPGVRFDLPGAVTLGAGATALLLAINRGDLLGWTSPFVLACLFATPVFLVAFVLIERRVAAPLFPLHYVRERNFTFPVTTQFFMNFAYMGGFVVTPLLLQDVFGYSETHSAALLIARPTVFAIAGPVAGYLTMRVGERPSAVFGAIAVVASMLALAALEPGHSDWQIALALGLSGLGMGAASPAMAAAIADTVDEADLGIAGAAQQMMNQVGIVLGIQVMQTVQQARETSVGALESFHEAYLVGAAAGVCSLVAALFVRTRRREQGAPEGALHELELSPAATQ